MKMLSRKEAVGLGLTRYFTGKPCKHQHISERLVSNRLCTVCSNNRCKEWLLKNRKGRENWLEAARQRERIGARNRYNANPEKFIAKVVNRRWQSQGQHTAADVKRILLRQGQICVYCKTSLKDKYHVDHITSLARGGSNGPENIQCLCPSCNLAKSDKVPEEYARSIGLLL